MNIHENFPLKKYHTFGVEVNCRYFADVTSVEHLRELLANHQWQNMPKLILGEGSNILFSQDFPGLVIKISLKGIKKIDENDEHAWIDAAAGENWHQLVMHCIGNQWAGIENLCSFPAQWAQPLCKISALMASRFGIPLKN